MNKILVPVDFSNYSRDAFIYAREMAKVLNFSLQVVNIYGNQFTSPDYPVATNEDDKKMLEARLQEFVKSIPDQENEAGVLTKVQIETNAIYGAVVTNQIVSMTENEAIIMVVMGTKGSHNRVEKMYGSVSSGVAQRGHCPVLLIPENTKYQSFENVMYASNYESIDEAMLNQIIDFGNLFRATMHFVHVEEQDNYDTIENVLFDKLFEKGDPTFSFNLVNIEDRTVMEGLNQYASENEVNLIVLVNRQRRFFENVFQMSLTQKMALRTQLPLMVFHLMNE